MLVFVRCGDFELIVAAIDGLLVGPPPFDRCVVKANALHVVAFQLAHARDPERLP